MSVSRGARLLWIIAALLIACAPPAFATNLPSFAEVKRAHRASDAVILDCHGEVIHELRVDPRGRRLDWTPLKEVSPALVKAVLQSEDRRFYEHSGVDWKAVSAAAIQRIFGSKLRGASTITMQVAMMVGKGTMPKGRKTLRQKWQQMEAARELEKGWTKEEILESYLNLVTFRSELQGVGAASAGLFDKAPSGLTERESCVLAALIRSPNALASDVGRRAAVLAASLAVGTDGDRTDQGDRLRLPRSQSPDGAEEARRLALDVLSRPYRLRARTALAPHAARILATGTATRVASTLDLRLQRFARDTLRQQLSSLQGRHVGDGAVLVVDNATGNILAYLASAGESQVDGILAKRQAGSTLKPFLYELGIEKRLLTAASVLEDTPLHLPTERGLYVPHDYDHRWRGPVSVRTALSSSLNIPAVRTQLLVGTEPFAKRLRRVGLELPRPADFYGFSLALGTADVSLKELVNAYRTLARGGLRGSLQLSPGGAGKTVRVMDRRAAHIVSDILADRSSRSTTFGLDNPLSTRYWTAVKTGTSKDMRDNWCVGFSGRYTVGVWVGNFSGEPMWNVSGVSGAAPVWIEVMNYLHHDAPSLPPQRPRGVLAVRASKAERDGGAELFLAGTEPPPALPPSVAGETVAHPSWLIPRISYPAEGTIIVIDPDIPEENQQLFFEARNGGNGLRWRLNGKLLAAGAEGERWAPRPGRYELTLVDSAGKAVDKVVFEVRGHL